MSSWKNLLLPALLVAAYFLAVGAPAQKKASACKTRAAALGNADAVARETAIAEARLQAVRGELAAEKARAEELAASGAETPAASGKGGAAAALADACGALKACGARIVAVEFLEGQRWDISVESSYSGIVRVLETVCPEKGLLVESLTFGSPAPARNARVARGTKVWTLRFDMSRAGN